MARRLPGFAHASPALDLRRLPLAASAALFWLAAPGLKAAGLGEVEQSSALGQPLELRIGLEDVDPGELDRLRVGVASNEVYDSLGMQRDPALNSATARLENRDGRVSVHVTSPARAQEPILGVVLELAYAGGKMRRSYSLLLDPPTMTARQPIAPASRLPELPELPEPAPLPVAMLDRHPQRPRAAARPGTSNASRYGPVRAGETLGEIAMQLRGAEHIALPTVIDRLYRANPQAFSGTVSTLKVGAFLTFNGPAASPLAVRATTVADAPIADTSAPVMQYGADGAVTVKTAFHGLRFSERLLRVPTLAEMAPSTPAAVAAAAVVSPSLMGRPLTASPRSSGFFGGIGALGSWLVAIMTLLFGWLLLRRYRAPITQRGQARAQSAPPRALPHWPADTELMTQLRSATTFSPRAGQVRDAAAEPVFEVEAEPEIEAPRRVQKSTQAAAEEGKKDEEPFWPGDLSTQATQLISEALLINPDRSDLRYMLLELHHGDHHVEAFVQQAEAFDKRDTGRLDRHWPEIERMGRELAPENPLFAPGGIAAPPGKPQAPGRAALSIRRFHDGIDRLPLQAALDELKTAHESLRRDQAFISAFSELMLDELARPSTLEHYRQLSEHLGGAQIYVKREDMRRLGSEQLIHIYGQVLLAKFMGKSMVVAAYEDGHGAAVAAAGAAIGMKTVIYVPETVLNGSEQGLEKMRQYNARLMPLIASDAEAVADGRRVAVEHWLGQRRDCNYISSQRAGPAPLPSIISDFQAVVGQEVRRQWYRRFGHLPSAIVANAEAGPLMFGLLRPFLNLKGIRLDCVERPVATNNAAKLKAEAAGPNPYLRELSWLRATGRVGFANVTRAKATDAARLVRRHEDGNPSTESIDALAHGIRIASGLGPEREVVVLYV